MGGWSCADAARRVILCWLYGAASLLALVGTWRQNVAYFRPEDGALSGFVLATGRFWVDTVVNPASTSITVDLGLLLLPLFALMIIESRRLGIPLVWAYIVLGLVVAEQLYRLFPGAAEGWLTVMRAEMVRGRNLAVWARRFDGIRQTSTVYSAAASVIGSTDTNTRPLALVRNSTRPLVRANRV